MKGERSIGEADDALGAFVRQTDTCPDCIERDDVDLLGRPRKGRHHRIRICVGCKGSARVPRKKPHPSTWPGQAS